MFEDHRLDTFVNQHSATYSGHGMNEKILDVFRNINLG